MQRSISGLDHRCLPTGVLHHIQKVTGKVLPAQHHDNVERSELMLKFSHLELSGKAQMGRPLLQQQEFL